MAARRRRGRRIAACIWRAVPFPSAPRLVTLRAMTRLRLALRRTTALTLVATAAAALAVTGCGRETKSNGLEDMSAAKVQQQAVEALNSAASTHVKGTGVLGGSPMRLDLRFDGSSLAGTLTAEGVTVRIIRIKDAFYVKSDRLGLRTLGASPAAQRLGADRWLKLGRQQITAWSGLSLADLSGQLSKDESPVDPAVTQTTLDGKQVVVVKQRDGSKLYVANTGVAYPLRGDFKGPVGGRIDFTHYGADFRITPPESFVDVGKLLARG